MPSTYAITDAANTSRESFSENEDDVQRLLQACWVDIFPLFFVEGPVLAQLLDASQSDLKLHDPIFWDHSSSFHRCSPILRYKRKLLDALIRFHGHQFSLYQTREQCIVASRRQTLVSEVHRTQLKYCTLKMSVQQTEGMSYHCVSLIPPSAKASIFGVRMVGCPLYDRSPENRKTDKHMLSIHN